MPIRDLHNNICVDNISLPAVATATVTPANGVDTRGFDSCELVCHMGNSGDMLSGTVNWQIRVQHSDDDTNYSAVTDANHLLFGGDASVTAPDENGAVATINAPAEDSKIFRIGYRGPKRFARLVVVAAGAHTNGTPIAIFAIKGHPHRSPVI